MSLINTRRLERLTYFSLTCVAIAWTTILLSVLALFHGKVCYARIIVYSDYFGSFIGFFIATIVEFALCTTSIIISSVCVKQMNKKWKRLNITIIVASSIRLLLVLLGLA